MRNSAFPSNPFSSNPGSGEFRVTIETLWGRDGIGFTPCPCGQNEPGWVDMYFRYHWECSGSGRVGPFFHAGDLVERSGLYRVLHGDERTETAVLLQGQPFTACDCCGEQVRYQLLRAAPYIFEDEDFCED